MIDFGLILALAVFIGLTALVVMSVYMAVTVIILELTEKSQNSRERDKTQSWKVTAEYNRWDLYTILVLTEVVLYFWF